MSNQPPKSTAHVPASPAGKGPHAAHAEPKLHDEDELHVPRGVSRGVGLFLIGLMIFLLIIWLVPGAMFGIAGGGESKNPVVVRFQVPSEGEVAWKASEMQMRERGLKDGLDVLASLGDRFIIQQLGVDMRQTDPKDLQRVLVLDHLAQAAGVEITNTDLVEHVSGVLSMQGAKEEDSSNIFKSVVQSRGLDQGAVEDSIRRVLRVSRFQQLIGYAGAVPDPKKIEEQWQRENVEFAFDYAVLGVESVKEDARKELPDEAGLEAWFSALDEGEKQEFKTAEKRKAEAALFRDSETTPSTELLSAFPEKPAEGAQPTEPEQLAHQYYENVFFRRFEKTAVEGETTPSGYFTFEEVKDACAAEAPVYFAMIRWLEDLNQRRANAETIDFAAEAQKYGLEHQAFLEPLARAQYEAVPDIGDADVANAIFATVADGSFYASPLPLSKGIVVVRVNERSEPTLPPFAEIREKVAEKWLEPKALELAQKRLNILREGLERFEPPAPKEGEPQPPKGTLHYRASPEAFRSALEGAGLSVATRDYLNRTGPATLDPQSKDADHTVLFSQANALGLYRLESDEVAAPGLSPDNEKVYLVRLVGKRDVPIEKMSPTQYKRYKSNARQQATFEIVQKLDLDFLKKNYGLWLYSEEQAAKAAAAKTGR